MKTVFAAACLLMAASACDVRREARERNEPRLMQELVYKKDTRPSPPICYAYAWQGSDNGGPGLATVPCESVEHLLVNK